MSVELFKYNQKQNVKTSLDITEITPVYWNKLNPGERISNLNFRNITRMITPFYPTLDNAYIDLFAFAVPKRIIQPENAEHNPNYNDIHSDYLTIDVLKMITSDDWKGLTPEFKQSYSPYTYSNNTSLLKKFGFNYLDTYNDQDQVLKTNRINLMYLLAYKKIYYDFFRQKQLEQTDYINFYNKLTSLNLNNNIPPSEYMWYLDKLNVCNVDNDYLNTLTFNAINDDFSKHQQWNSFKKLMFDNFLQNDKIINHIDYGTQKDILLKVWNTDNYDKTSAQLIGFQSFQQSIKQVVNQSKGTADTQSLGEVGGMSLTFNEGQLINEYIATEPTYIMVLAVPNYKMVIRNLFNANEWDNINDFNPNMEYIQQPVKSSTFLNSYNDGVIYGYDKPYNYLRKKPDIVCGEIAGNWSTWTYSVDFNPGDGGIGLDILKAQKKPFKETLVSPNQDSFITEWEFIGDFYRALKPDFVIADSVIKGE